MTVVVVVMVMCPSVYMCGMCVGLWKGAYYSIHVEVRGQLSGVGSLLLPWALGKKHGSLCLRMYAFLSEHPLTLNTLLLPGF